MLQSELKEILGRYLEGNATLEESAIIEKWYEDIHEIGEEEVSDEMGDEIFSAIQNAMESRRKHSTKVVRWSMRIAASLLVVVAIGYAYFLYSGKDLQDAAITENIGTQNDVAPGGNKAILTLADGLQVVLDSANNGAISQQGGVVVIKLDDGALSYEDSNTPASEIVYNTITTPRGGQYQLVLSDGSKIWLNAESSLRFPVKFADEGARNVQLTGEGYFEVAHQDGHAFTVTVNEMKVEVLGTHFNINAYDGRTSMKTTLLEGSVRVTNQGDEVIIKPGEQATVVNGKMQVKKDVNTDEAIAWKNGLFRFNDTSIEEVMRQISRWYDVAVSYPNGVPKDKYWGSIRRDQNLKDVLDVLKESGAHFKVEGYHLIVTPN